MRRFAIFAALAAATLGVGIAQAKDKGDAKTKADPPEILVASELFLKADANSDGFLNKKEFKNAAAMLQERIAEMAQAGTLASIGVQKPKDQKANQKQADKAAAAPTAGLALAKADSGDSTTSTTPTQPKNTMTLDEFKVYVTNVMDTAAAEFRAAEQPPHPAHPPARRTARR